MATLTIRNLTNGYLNLKSIEVLSDPNSRQSQAIDTPWQEKDGQTTKSSTLDSTVETAHPQCKYLAIVLEYFESVELNLDEILRQSSSPPSALMLRLTIHDQNDTAYNLDINPSNTQKSSHPLLCPSHSTSTSSFTALFHPSRTSPHITIHTHTSISPNKWMSALPPTLPLSAISIPGTHNSHTCYRALPSVRCQFTSIDTQLAHGIRFLDIRLQSSHAKDITKKDMLLVHGAFPISFTGAKYFAPILATCYDFLAANPSETILMSLKREGVGGGTDEFFSRILLEHYILPNASKWYISDTIPTLGSVRGKIVLIRRYKIPQDAKDISQGLDATAWPDSAHHALFPMSPMPVFCLQDFYNVLEPNLIGKKVGYCNEHLVRAAGCTHVATPAALGVSQCIDGVGGTQIHPLYLNFLSASNFWRRACWPENIAKVLNRGVEEWLCRGHGLELEDTMIHGKIGAVTRRAKNGDSGTGIVIMDCVGESEDWDLVNLIIGMNMGVVKKGRDVS